MDSTVLNISQAIGIFCSKAMIAGQSFEKYGNKVKISEARRRLAKKTVAQLI